MGARAALLRDGEAGLALASELSASRGDDDGRGPSQSGQASSERRSCPRIGSSDGREPYRRGGRGQEGFEKMSINTQKDKQGKSRAANQAIAPAITIAPSTRSGNGSRRRTEERPALLSGSARLRRLTGLAVFLSSVSCASAMSSRPRRRPWRPDRQTRLRGQREPRCRRQTVETATRAPWALPV